MEFWALQPSGPHWGFTSVRQSLGATAGSDSTEAWQPGEAPVLTVILVQEYKWEKGRTKVLSIELDVLQKFCFHVDSLM